MTHRKRRRCSTATIFAATMTWEYSLIDANWHLLPEGALERVIAHAKAKHVGLLLWSNSGRAAQRRHRGAARSACTTQRKRRAEFARAEGWGVKGVKVDFWHSDKQADRAIPRLLQGRRRLPVDGRTFTDRRSRAAGRGCSQSRSAWRRSPARSSTSSARIATGRLAQHGAAFTRNVIGPMDYTPVTFSDAKYPHQTTNAHELALSVVFESGIQHFADGPRGLRRAAGGGEAVPEGRPGGLGRHEAGRGDTWHAGGHRPSSGHELVGGRHQRHDVAADSSARSVVSRRRRVRRHHRPGRSAAAAPRDRVGDDARRRSHEHPAVAARRVCHAVCEEVNSRRPPREGLIGVCHGVFSVHSVACSCALWRTQFT